MSDAPKTIFATGNGQTGSWNTTKATFEGPHESQYTLTSSISAQLKAAYLAGFNASGEGWNGEYPYGDNNASPTTDQTWIAARDAALSEITPIPD